jgi:hypothetical protein
MAVHFGKQVAHLIIGSKLRHYVVSVAEKRHLETEIRSGGTGLPQSSYPCQEKEGGQSRLAEGLEQRMPGCLLAEIGTI